MLPLRPVRDFDLAPLLRLPGANDLLQVATLRAGLDMARAGTVPVVGNIDIPEDEASCDVPRVELRPRRVSVARCLPLLRSPSATRLMTAKVALPSNVSRFCSRPVA